MRLKIAIALAILGLLVLGTGIGQRTIWLPPATLTASAPAGITPAPLTVISPELLKTRDGQFAMTVKSDGPIQVAVARQDDITGWIGNAAYTKIGATNKEFTALTSESVEGEEQVPNPSGSDMWVSEEKGTGELSYTWQAPGHGDWALLVSSDGTAPAPTDISITVDNEAGTPWAVPLMVVGSALLALAALLFIMSPRKPKEAAVGQGRRAAGRVPADPATGALEVAKIVAAREAARAGAPAAPAATISEANSRAKSRRAAGAAASPEAASGGTAGAGAAAPVVSDATSSLPLSLRNPAEAKDASDSAGDAGDSAGKDAGQDAGQKGETLDGAASKGAGTKTPGTAADDARKPDEAKKSDSDDADSNGGNPTPGAGNGVAKTGSSAGKQPAGRSAAGESPVEKTSAVKPTGSGGTPPKDATPAKDAKPVRGTMPLRGAKPSAADKSSGAGKGESQEPANPKDQAAPKPSAKGKDNPEDKDQGKDKPEDKDQGKPNAKERGQAKGKPNAQDKPRGKGRGRDQGNGKNMSMKARWGAVLAAVLLAGSVSPALADDATTAPASPAPESSAPAAESPAAESIIPNNAETAAFPNLLDSQVEKIAASVASVVASGDNARNATELESRVAGMALEVRAANYTIRAQVEKQAPVEPVNATKLLAKVVTTTTPWPRSFMVVTQGENNELPQLLTLVQASARENYKLVNATPLLPGQTFPKVDKEGTKAVDLKSADGLKMSPEAAIAALSDRLTTADSKFNDTFEDSVYITSVMDLQAQVVADAKDADYVFSHKADLESAVSFRTADGGAMVVVGNTFGIDATSKEEATLTVGDDAAVFTGGKETTTGFTLTYAEPVVMYIPPANGGDKLTLLSANRGLVGGSFKE